MRAAVFALLVACGGNGGGSQVATPAKPVEPPKQQSTRVVIEDSTQETDDLQVVSRRGHMEPDVVQAGLAPHTQSLSDCYTSRVGRRRWLGGHVAIRWDIKRTGEVTAVKLAESDLGAWPVEKCLLEIARMATFGKPVGGNADFSIPLDFTAKGTVINWEEAEAIKAVGKQLATLEECHNPKDKKLPRLKPPKDVTITIYVGPQGKAQSVGFASPKSVLEDAWADCAEQAVLAWKLPDPKGIVAKLAIKYR
jgi:hypothetical protein